MSICQSAVLAVHNMIKSTRCFFVFLFCFFFNFYPIHLQPQNRPTLKPNWSSLHNPPAARRSRWVCGRPRNLICMKNHHWWMFCCRFCLIGQVLGSFAPIFWHYLIGQFLGSFGGLFRVYKYLENRLISFTHLSAQFCTHLPSTRKRYTHSTCLDVAKEEKQRERQRADHPVQDFSFQ